MGRKDCCRLCSYKAARTQQVKIHFEEVYWKDIFFVCFKCDWLYIDIRKLRCPRNNVTSVKNDLDVDKASGQILLSNKIEYDWTYSI